MLYIVLFMLGEVVNVWYFVLTAGLFVLSQLDYFLLNKVICNVCRALCDCSWVLTVILMQGTSHKIDGSFVATVLETATVGALFLAWRSITEGDILLLYSCLHSDRMLFTTADFDTRDMEYYPSQQLGSGSYSYHS